MGAGFQLSRSQSSAEFSGVTETFDVDGAHAGIIAIGDVVTLSGTSTVTPIGSQMAGRAQVDSPANGTSPFTGIVCSIVPDLSNESLNDAGGLPATTAGSVVVVLDNASLFEVESDLLIAADGVGLNFDFIDDVATQTGGLSISNMELDGSSGVVTKATPFRLVKLLEGLTSGILGDRALVRMNDTTTNDGATGIA